MELENQICLMQSVLLLDAALGMDSKRLRIANYSELIPVDQIYDKILPNVQLTIIKEPRSKKQKEQKFVLLSRLIRMDDSHFTLRHQLNGKVISKQELARFLLSFGINLKQPVFVLQQSSATLSLLKSDNYLVELCMTAAGVKSCFDGVSFAKEKVTEWQEEYRDISENIRRLQSTLDHQIALQVELNRSLELRETIHSLSEKLKKLKVLKDQKRAQTLSNQIVQLVASENELKSQITKTELEYSEKESECRQSQKKVEELKIDIQKLTERQRKQENKKFLMEENLHELRKNFENITREKERVEASILDKEAQRYMSVINQKSGIAYQRQLHLLLSSDLGDPNVIEDHMQWIASEIQRRKDQVSEIENSRQSLEKPDQRNSTSLCNFNQEIDNQRELISTLKNEIISESDLSQIEEELLSIKQKEKAFVERSRSLDMTITRFEESRWCKKPKIIDGVNNVQIVHEVFHFKSESEPFLSALATISSGTKSLLVSSSQVANILAQRTQDVIWALDRLKDVHVNLDQQRQIQSQFPKGDILLPQDLIVFSPEYQRVVNRLFGSWVISKTHSIADELLKRYNTKSVTCDTLSLISSGSLTGGFRNPIQGFFHQKFTHDIGKAEETKTQELIRVGSLKKTQLICQIEGQRQKRYKLELAIQHRDSLLEKQKIQNDVFKSESETNLEKQKRIIEAGLKLARAEIDQFQQQISVCKNLSGKELQYHLEQEDFLQNKTLASATHNVTQCEASLIFDKNKVVQFLSCGKNIEGKIRDLTTVLVAAQTEIGQVMLLLQQNQGECQGLERKVATLKERMLESANAKEQLSISLKQTQKEKAFAIQEDESLQKKIQELIIPEEDTLHFVQSNFSDLEDKIDRLKVELELIEEQEGFSKRRNHQIAAALMTQISEIKVRQQQMLDSIAELKNGVQKAETFAQSALEETFEELNKNAQKTFQYLAPSKRMILHKTGERVQDGVNVKVANIDQEGNPTQWQTESSFLSGGQKSLLALSCCFAALQSSKLPQQFIILDEVDAALGLEAPFISRENKEIIHFDFSDGQNSQTLAQLLSLPPLNKCQVISVSHHSSFFKEASQVILIGKSGAFSVVSTQTKIR